MTTRRIVVLGASGMLGSMVASVLSRSGSFNLVCTARSEAAVSIVADRSLRAVWRVLDAEQRDEKGLAGVLDGASWVINAIGIIKPYIHEDKAAEIERAVVVNSLFPHLLAKAAAACGCRVLQIATDCVYSGKKGAYVEEDAHDAFDVYGKTKSLGEVYSNSVSHLRCSIIGPELKSHVSLLDWFLGQPQAADVNGFVNHLWNGVTTFHFGKLCEGIISKDLILPHMQHIVPDNSVSKAELLRYMAETFGREDITIKPMEAGTRIDRTLSTSDNGLNRMLWEAAGYRQPPTVFSMLSEMAEFNYKLVGLSE